MRGSRKHILDWTDRPEFPEDLLRLAQPVTTVLSDTSVWMPRGHGLPKEARLELFGPTALPHVDWANLRKWWLRHERGANTPNWDIALTCDIESRPGVILVEGKANVAELGSTGKSLDSEASDASRENHERISTAISEACTALRSHNPTIAISRDSHYQLSNRVAFAWKLASLGVPTVLVYLGFIGDTGIRDAGQPFLSESHWQEVFAEHSRAVFPPELTDRRIDCANAPMWLLVRSRPPLEVSPARSSSRPRADH